MMRFRLIPNIRFPPLSFVAGGRRSDAHVCVLWPLGWARTLSLSIGDFPETQRGGRVRVIPDEIRMGTHVNRSGLGTLHAGHVREAPGVVRRERENQNDERAGKNRSWDERTFVPESNGAYSVLLQANGSSGERVANETRLNKTKRTTIRDSFENI